MSEAVCSCRMCQTMWLGGDEMTSASVTMVSSPDSSLAGTTSQEASAVFSTSSSDLNVRGIQFGTQWSGAIRYSFTTSTLNYESTYSDSALYTGFSPVTITQALAVRDILGGGLSGPTYFAYGSFSAVTNAAIFEVANTSGLNTAEIRIADTLAASTAYAYLPSNDFTGGGRLDRSVDRVEPGTDRGDLRLDDSHPRAGSRLGAEAFSPRQPVQRKHCA